MNRLRRGISFYAYGHVKPKIRREVNAWIERLGYKKDWAWEFWFPPSGRYVCLRVYVRDSKGAIVRNIQGVPTYRYVRVLLTEETHFPEELEQYLVQFIPPELPIGVSHGQS